MNTFTKITEQSSLYHDLEKKTTSELLAEINREDHKVADAVQQTIPQLTTLVDGIVSRMKEGGRLFYMGAGTSGRIGVLDASEIPPTYGMDPKWVVGLICGGDTALRNPVENAEDNRTQGWKDLQAREVCARDTIVGIAASGTTPYVIEALRNARAAGCLTACITSNPGSPLTEVAEIPIVTVVGPEYVTGSSRMKSGTAQKLVCNMITTSVMIQLGRVHDNRMVNMRLSNAKLIDRGTRMVMIETGLEYEEANKLLLHYGEVKAAVTAFRG